MGPFTQGFRKLSEKNRSSFELSENMANMLFLGRKAKFKTQMEVFEETGVSQGNISKWEGNLCRPDATHWLTLFIHYGLDLDSIYDGYLDNYSRLQKSNDKNVKGSPKGFTFRNLYRSDRCIKVRQIVPLLLIGYRHVEPLKFEAILRGMAYDHRFFLNFDHQINMTMVRDIINSILASGKPIKAADIESSFLEARFIGILKKSKRFPRFQSEKKNLESLLSIAMMQDNYFQYDLDIGKNYRFSFLPNSPKKLEELNEFPTKVTKFIKEYYKMYWEMILNNIAPSFELQSDWKEGFLFEAELIPKNGKLRK